MTKISKQFLLLTVQTNHFENTSQVTRILAGKGASAFVIVVTLMLCLIGWDLLFLSLGTKPLM